MTFFFAIFSLSRIFLKNSIREYFKDFFEESSLRIWFDKDWVKKWTTSEIENTITSPILFQSNGFFSNMKYSRGGYFDKVSF